MKKKYSIKNFINTHLVWVSWLLLLLVSFGARGQGVGYGNGSDGVNGLMGVTSAVVFLDINGTTTKHAMSAPAAWGGGCGHDGGADNIGDVGKTTPYVLPVTISDFKLKGELLQASSNSPNRNFALEYKWYHENESEPSWTARTPVYMNSGHTSSYCGNLKHAMSTWYTLPLSASGNYYLKVRFRMHNSQDGSLTNANNYHGGFIEGYTARFSYNPQTIHYKATSTDFQLTANGDGTYSVDNAVVNGGSGYFYNKLSGGSTDKYWGGTTAFPNGTATQSGGIPATKIASTAGTYNITFNPSTGAYTFTAVLAAVQKITSAKVTMDVYDTLDGGTDTNWYVLNGSQGTLGCHEDVGNLDFNPTDDSFIHTLGLNSTLKIGGEVRTNNDPNPVKMHYRVYLVGSTPPAFTTRELKFDRFLTNGTECGNQLGQRGTQYNRAASSGATVTLSTAGNYYVEVYYEAGGVISAGTGGWSHNGYSMIGDAAAGWSTDIQMGESKTGVHHYYRYTFTTNGLKFRTTGSWGTSYGGSVFPYSTSTDTNNIPVTAGTYNVTFDRNNQDYVFTTYNGTSTYFNNSDGSNYKALIKVVDVIDDGTKDSDDGSFGFTDGALDPGCTQCSGLFESYMGLYIIDANGAVVADRVYNLDGAYGSANTSNLDLGAQYPGVTFRIGTEAKAWAKGRHKMCGCSSWYYTYEFSGTDPVESDFPLPSSGSKFSDLTNGLFTLMNTSDDLGTNTPMPRNPVSTAAGQGSGNFAGSVNKTTSKGLAYEDNIKGLNIWSYNHSDFASSTYSFYANGSTTDHHFMKDLTSKKRTGGVYDSQHRMIYDQYFTGTEAASWFKVRNNDGWGGPNWGSPWSYPNGNMTSPGSNITGISEGNYTLLFDSTTGNLQMDTTVLYRWKDFTNGATTTAVLTPYNEVACPTCGGEYKVAVAMLCWASNTGDCTDETSLYYHRDINQNKVHEGVALNPHHPNSPDKPSGSVNNTYAGTELFYVQKISIASGGATNTWNGSTWSVTGAALPESYQDADVDSDLTIADGQGFTCINLDVADGVTITLGSGSYIEVLRAANTNSTGKIIVPSDANFVQRCDNQDHTAHIVHTKNTRTIAVGDYGYLSSPLAPDENMIPMVTAAGMGRMFEWSNNVESNKDWSYITTTVGKPGEGFIAWNPPGAVNSSGLSGGSIKSFAIEIDGTAYNGECTVNVRNEDLDINNDDNYVLIGNPYACAVDSELFLTHPNNANMDGTLYYWTSNTRIQEGDEHVSNYGDYNKYDYNPNDYASWSLSGATSTAASPETTNDTLVGNSSAPTKWWPSATSVFMRPIADGTVFFNNSMRSTTSNSATLFRSGNRGERIKSRLYLNINNGKGAFRQMGLAYVPGATDGRDRLFDSELYTTSDASIYTINGNTKYAIEGRPYQSLDKNETIPLGYNSKNEDEFQISIDRFDGNFDAKEIFLRDIQKDSLHNLSERPYVFGTNSGEYNDRFELVMKDKERLVEESAETAEEFPLIVAVKDDKIVVNKMKEKITKVEVHSLLGKLLYTGAVDSISVTEIEGLKRNDQVIIVTVYYEDGFKEHKKVLY